MQIAAACSENHSGPFSDAFFGLGVAEWCDFSVLVAFQRPPVFRSDSTKKRYCWGPALRQNFCTWQVALNLGPSGLSKNIAMWHPNVPTKKPFELHPRGSHFTWKNTRSPPGAHHFTWKNTRNPPECHHFTWKNTRSPPGAHHFTWKNTRNPPECHHFTWKNTRSPTFHPLGNIVIIEKW